MTQTINWIHASRLEERLDKLVFAYLQHQIEGVTRSQIKQWIEKEMVSVAGEVARKAGFMVAPGDKVQVQIPNFASTLQASQIPLVVLFEDEDLIVIDKPAGLSMHPGAGQKSETLVNALMHHFKQRSSVPEIFQHKTSKISVSLQRPGIIHRLDKDTTGIVVIAKTLEAQSKLSEQFHNRSVGRSYLALVFCTPRAKRIVNVNDSGTVETLLGRHPTKRTLITVTEGKGRTAITHWKVKERFEYGCLLAITLGTGRTHQIRVHMNHIHSPVIGDRTYGDFSGLPQKLQRAQESFGRQALHAFRLEFDHPKTGKRLSFESPLPDDLRNLLKEFRASK